MITLIIGIICLIIYLMVGISLAVRVKTLVDSEKCDDISEDIIWILIFAWVIVGIIKIWKNGVDDI